MIDGKVYWFGAAGLANGLSVMRDEETESLWDHITGECFAGALAGHKLDFWPVTLTQVEAELKRHPDTILLKSDYRSLASFGMKLLNKTMSYRRKGTVLLPVFRKTMNLKIDPRLPEGEQGLGLMNATEHGKFYPVNLIPIGGMIEDEWQGRTVRIERNALDGVPVATWIDNGEQPMQLVSRWYGFAFTYPNCEIYSLD